MKRDPIPNTVLKHFRTEAARERFIEENFPERRKTETDGLFNIKGGLLSVLTDNDLRFANHTTRGQIDDSLRQVTVSSTAEAQVAATAGMQIIINTAKPPIRPPPVPKLPPPKKMTEDERIARAKSDHAAIVGKATIKPRAPKKEPHTVTAGSVWRDNFLYAGQTDHRYVKVLEILDGGKVSIQKCNKDGSALALAEGKRAPITKTDTKRFDDSLSGFSPAKG